MAGYQILYPNRRPQNGRHTPADPIGLLSSTIIAGLGLFGLAVNGTCLAAFNQPAAQRPSNFTMRQRTDERSRSEACRHS
jgi:hypothetical protein